MFMYYTCIIYNLLTPDKNCLCSIAMCNVKLENLNEYQFFYFLNIIRVVWTTCFVSVNSCMLNKKIKQIVKSVNKVLITTYLIVLW